MVKTADNYADFRIIASKSDLHPAGILRGGNLNTTSKRSLSPYWSVCAFSKVTAFLFHV